MSSIVPSSSGKTADFHQTDSHGLSSGSLNGRTVDSETSHLLPKEFIVPKMSDLHPEIRMDDLPQSLARNLNGFNAIEIQLCHIFHMTTESTLLELQQMFGKANVEEIIVRFSFITTIINTLNKAMRTSKSYRDESLDVSIREMTLLLPALVKNLLEQWEEKEKALDRMKMGANTRKAALEKTQEVKELFHYLSQMINENELRIEVFATPTIHLLQSNESKDNSIDHWLERMLKIHTTMLRSFSSSSVFWNNTTNGPHDIFRDRLTMINKLISRRRENLKSSNQCPNASLFQLHETLCNEWGKVGGMYTRAQLLLNSQQGVKHGKPLGFFPDLFQKLNNELDPEHRARVFSFTMSTAPFYINLHRQYLPITQTMMCCALAKGVRSKRASLDIKTLDTIIQEAKEFWFIRKMST